MNGVNHFGVSRLLRCIIIAVLVVVAGHCFDRWSRRLPPSVRWSSVDANNLAQVARALENYAADHGDCLPVYEDGEGLRRALFPKYLTTERVLFCPYIRDQEGGRFSAKGMYHVPESVRGQALKTLPPGSVLVEDVWPRSIHPGPIRRAIIGEDGGVHMTVEE